MAGGPGEAGYESLVSPWARLTGYDRFEFERRRVAWIRRVLPDLRAERILNFGCGTATVTPSLRDAFAPRVLLGVDVDEGHLEAARAAHPGEGTAFLHLDAYAPAGDMDLAYCNGVFHHIPPASRPGSARLVLESLRPGGVFALWENNPFNPVMRTAMALAEIDRDAIPLRPAGAARLLREAGFEVGPPLFAFFFPRLLGFLRGAEPALRSVPLGAQYLLLARKP